jgi:uncharacterized integral membrane protein (TIGR00698 family)
VRPLLPGLAVAAATAGVAQLLGGLGDAVSSLALAVAFGIVLGNSRRLPETTAPGLTFAAKRVLRLGVVLLGSRLALGEVLAVGAETLVVVLVVVVATLIGTYAFGRSLGLSRELSVLTGTGYAICGASAVAAMREVVEADDDEAAFAVALVTLFGTLAIVVLPLLGGWLALDPTAFGQWVGASVHDVGQVVATAASGGPDALAVAMVVKLTRVLLLGPLVLVVGVLWARRRHAESAHPADARPTLLPLFVVGFLVAAVVRSLGLLPASVLAALGTAERWAFAVALVGLGAGVRLDRLRRVGRRGVVLGTVAWVAVAGVAYLGVLAVHALGGTNSTINGA